VTVANIMVVFGTRPEAVKMAPIVRELKKHPARLRPVVVVTAQHREMLDQVLELFEIEPDYDLNIMKDRQSLSDVTSNVLKGMEDILAKEAIDLMIVQGDTTTTFSAALAAFYQQIPVAHVEAGLRTFQMYNPFPEEVNRVLTTRLSSVHFAPTEQAQDNLLREGIPQEDVVVTGNTVIDALLSIVDPADSQLNGNGHPGRKVLVTAHRRESLGEPMRQVCLAILDIVNEHEDVEVVFPVHLNPRVQETVRELLSEHERIQLIDPLPYREFSQQIAESYLILTDSGGVQEEAPSLGKPVLVLRNETERQEGVDAGTCRLVGTNRSEIFTQADRLLSNEAEYQKMAQAVNPYGDGSASRRIVEWILQRFPQAN